MKSYRIYLEKHNNGVYQVWNDRGVHCSIDANFTAEKIYNLVNEMNRLDNNTKLIAK